MRVYGGEGHRIRQREKLMCNVVATKASDNPIGKVTLGETVPEAE